MSAREPLPYGARRLSSVERRSVEWLWRRYLPRGKLIMLDGDPGVAKSTVSADLAARLSTGGDWPDGTPCPKVGNTVILSAEDSAEDTIAPRVLAASGDLDRVAVVDGVPSGDTDENGGAILRLPTLDDIARLHEIITAMQADLVILDVLSAYWPAKMNSNDEADVKQVLYRLSALAESTRSVIAALRHLNKGDGLNALYRGLGSISIGASARGVFLAGRDPNNTDQRVIAPVKVNLSEEPPSLAYRLTVPFGHLVPRVEWLGESRLTANALLAPADTGRRSPALHFLAAFLEAHGGGAAVTDINAAGERHNLSKDAHTGLAASSAARP